MDSGSLLVSQNGELSRSQRNKVKSHKERKTSNPVLWTLRARTGVDSKIHMHMLHRHTVPTEKEKTSLSDI